MTGKIRAVLFDMDGILYDSMPGHAKAWMAMCAETGLKAREEEFFEYEGRTGAATIDILIRRQYGRPATDDEARALYAIKSRYFAASGTRPIMPGAREAVMAVMAAGAVPVLVTGSGQASLLERLEHDFPGAFPPGRRVTAHDVIHGKPHPEPFLRGLEKAGVSVGEAIAVDNAPLGVQSASAAGIYTLGVITGPLADGSLLAAGADEELRGMEQCHRRLTQLL